MGDPLTMPRAKTSAVGSAGQNSHAGACASCHTGYMLGLPQLHSVNAPGGLQTSVTPRRGNTSGTRRSGWSMPLHHRRLCTWLCQYGRHILWEILFFTLGHRCCLRVQSLPGPRFPFISGFWVCASGSRRQETQVAPHLTPAVFVPGYLEPGRLTGGQASPE